LADEFNVPLTPAQQTQGKAMSGLESLLRKTLTGSGIFRDFDLSANKRVIEAGQKIGRAMSDRSLSNVEAGKFIQSALSKADELNASNYETVVDQISGQGGATTLVPVDGIVAVAKNLLKELKGPTEKAPGLRGVESLNKAIGILEDFAGLEKKVSIQRQVGVRTPAHEVAGEVTSVPSTSVIPVRQTPAGRIPTPKGTVRWRGDIPQNTVPNEAPPGSAPAANSEIQRSRVLGGVQNPGRSIEVQALPTNVASKTGTVTGKSGEVPVQAAISWDEARSMRSLLFKISRTGEVDIGKGAISQITAAVDDAMTKGLEQVGRKDLAQQFRGASNRFRINSELLKTSTMEAIARSDKPGLILDVLKQDPATGITTFRRLAHSQPGVVEAVERKLWENVFADAQTEGVLLGNSLERHLDKGLGGEAAKAIWGRNPETLDKIKRFVKLADTMSLRPSLTTPESSANPSLMSLGQSGAALGALTGAVESVFHNSPAGFALSLGALGSVTVGPYQLAKAMTSPRNTEMLIQALKTPAASSAGVKLGVRIAAAIGLGSTKDDVPELWPAHKQATSPNPQPLKR
jgi:hypothetical protein